MSESVKVEPRKEIELDGHKYRLVDGDPLTPGVHRRATEIQALMNEFGFTYKEAVKVWDTGRYYDEKESKPS